MAQDKPPLSQHLQAIMVPLALRTQAQYPAELTGLVLSRRVKAQQHRTTKRTTEV